MISEGVVENSKSSGCWVIIARKVLERFSCRGRVTNPLMAFSRTWFIICVCCGVP